MYDFWRRLREAFVPGDLGRKLRGIDRCGRAASIGVTAILLLSTLFAFDSAATMGAVTARAEVATALRQRLNSALADVTLEESLQPHGAGGGSRRFLAYERAAAVLDRDLQAVARLGDSADRAFATAALSANRTDVGRTTSPFAAAARSDGPGGLVLTGGSREPAAAPLSAGIRTRAAGQQLRAAQAWDRLRAVQQRGIVANCVLSLLGVACLAVVFLIFGAYRRGITALHAAELQHLEEAALTDNLTGLGNHRAYQEDLHREISRAKRHGHELTLALVDVDDLKLLNDENGHLYGDRVLKALGALLGGLRDEDRAYRIGGDEFSVLFAQTSSSQACETMERLRVRAQETLLGGTISAGLATLSPDCDAETLHARADAALYARKRGGRNGLTTYDASAETLSVVSPAKVGNLRAMIADKGLSVAFQPVWDVKRAAVLAYEALARPAPAYGFAGPQEAFDLAERVGRAHELDAVSRQATLAQAASLPEETLLFMNMSPQSFARRGLDIVSFTAEVRAAGLSPDRVVIEITERCITRPEEVIAVGKSLQSAGFRLALDDVGSGNAGLAMLTELNVDFVKIDRGVIVKATLNANARGVLAGIIVIAKSTGAYVIAEGVESVEMLDLVCRASIDWQALERGIQGAQGYLLRRPSPEFLSSGETDEIRALVNETLASGRDVPTAKSRSSLARRWEQFA